MEAALLSPPSPDLHEALLTDDSWLALGRASGGADDTAERSELWAAIRACIAEGLTPHQRQVLVSLAIDGVPIDVLAERLDTNRNALYKALHDARRKLRAELEERGFTP